MYPFQTDRHSIRRRRPNYILRTLRCAALPLGEGNRYPQMKASGPSRRASTGADARPPYEGRSRPPVTPHTPPLSSTPPPARYAGYLGAETAPVTMSSPPPLRAPATSLLYRTTSARGLANPSPCPSSVEMASVGGGGSGVSVERVPFAAGHWVSAFRQPSPRQHSPPAEPHDGSS
jgi:hypothetical protein